MKSTFFSIFFLTIVSGLPAGEPTSPSTPSAWTSLRPDGHAPIGVMRDHTHSAGQFMLSYRVMHMSMGGNFVGSDQVSDRQVITPTALGGQGFLVTPTEMTMTMHMLGAMFAPTEDLTLLAMVPYVLLEMDHLRSPALGAPRTFTTASEGFGDASLGLLYDLLDLRGQKVHGGLQLILPTGKTDQTDFVPGPGETRLPYPMQSGFGSWGLQPSLTYLVQSGAWSGGAQGSYQFFLQKNQEDYRPGNRAEATAWLARQLAPWLSASLRVKYSRWENIRGRDPQLLPLPVPTTRPDLRGGDRVDLAAGLNLYQARTGLRFGLEYLHPVWQDLDGPQLGSRGEWVAGIQLAW
ncbi:MAG: transporter [Verrucomicrobiota bacterium]